MSASRNADSVANQGEFSSRVERDEPMTTHGHKPGVLASERDRAPEFSAQTLPAGSAPADRTFAPNPTSEVPNLAQSTTTAADTSAGTEEDTLRSKASDTLGGASSADVHTGLGHPGQGQSSAEVRHEGKSHRAHQGSGLEGVGTSGGPATGGRGVDARLPEFAGQRGLDKDEVEGGTRGTIGGLAAQERVPEGNEK
ncbi:MAG: hypothetical protein M1821_010030 [Bathelium mastoideum]|nr:MAG: hypothetical protein M1821_010030 [Bathelium mastoideum]